MQNVINTPIGKLGIEIKEGALVRLAYLAKTTSPKKQNSPLLDEVVAQLNAYFANPHHVFTLPICTFGTDLQKLIWKALSNIPVGTTKTYGELAQQLNTSPRVIGNACRANPLPIIIPCHRVVAANHMGGYAGQKQGKFIQIKKWLLEYEVSTVKKT